MKIYIDFEQQVFIMTILRDKYSISNTLTIKNKLEVIEALISLTTTDYSFLMMLEKCDCFDESEKEYYKLKYA